MNSPRTRSAMLLRVILCVLAMLAVSGAAAQGERKARINISGSDTMNVLSTRLAEQYMKVNDRVQITVTGGGSSRGIADLIAGLNDIAQSSRDMGPKEMEKAREAALDPQEFAIALDGLAVIVHESSPVRDLSVAQVGAIFSGAIKNWKDVGGPDRPITLCAREANSGTYDFFREHVLKGKDFAPATNYLAATSAVAQQVANNENAIGFGGIGYFAHAKGVRCLGIRARKDSPAISPVVNDKVNNAAVQSGEYPISRPLHFYTARIPEGEVRTFLRWIITEDGQRIVEETEYIPLNPELIAEMEGKLGG